MSNKLRKIWIPKSLVTHLVNSKMYSITLKTSKILIPEKWLNPDKESNGYVGLIPEHVSKLPKKELVSKTIDSEFLINSFALRKKPKEKHEK